MAHHGAGRRTFSCLLLSRRVELMNLENYLSKLPWTQDDLPHASDYNFVQVIWRAWGPGADMELAALPPLPDGQAASRERQGGNSPIQPSNLHSATSRAVQRRRTCTSRVRLHAQTPAGDGDERLGVFSTGDSERRTSNVLRKGPRNDTSVLESDGRSVRGEASHAWNPGCCPRTRRVATRPASNMVPFVQCQRPRLAENLACSSLAR